MSLTGSNTNLDLTEVESDDVDQLASKIESFYKNDSATKSQLAWSWERNHLMLDGKQWITFEGSQATGGMWKPLRVSKANEYIPRPVTNYLFDVYQTLKSYLIKNKPRSTVYPQNTNSYRDKVAAELATMCCEVNWSRLREQQNYEYAAATLITYGTVFKKDYWDTTTINMVKVPRMEQRPVTDPQSGMPTGATEEVPVLSPEGDVVYDEMPLGDVNTEIVEPYRIAIDPLAMDLHKARWVMEYSIQPLQWIVETYQKEAEGYTNLADTVKEEAQLSNSLKRFFNLKTSSGVRNNGMETASGQDIMVQNAAVVKEYYERPSAKYQKGRLIVVANGVTLYSGDSPYSGTEHGDWHPYSECRWELVPGRFWGRGPLDDAVEVQKQINSIDSLIVLVRKTMAIPQKLIPTGIGITPGEWTGRPSQEIYYKDNGTGAKPEVIQPSHVDQQVFAEREQRVADLKEISGAIDILKGDRPPGVNAASALSLLYEVGTGKLFPVLDRWKALVEGSQKKQLQMIQKFYKEPRPEFIRSLRAKNNQLSDQEISNFLGTDLYDHCNVVVEAGSNVPKLQAAHQARLVELANIGVLNLQLPANRMQFLQDLGVMGYDNDIGPDVKRAEWENSLLDNIANSPDNMPIVLDADAHDVHISTHERRQKEPSFLSLPPEAQRAYAQHIQRHQQFEQQKMQAQILQEQATGQPPQPQTGGTSPQPIQPAGKGLSKDMKNAVMGADLKNPGNVGQ
jgi:hypothetical protein